MGCAGLMLWMALAGGTARADDPATAPPAAGDDAGGAEQGGSDSDTGQSGAGGDSEGSGDQGGEGSDDEGGESAPPPTIAPGGPQIDLSRATEAPALTEAQHDFLKPRRSELPQYPYAQTDFTAYSLEWGEVKLGLASITAGVLPRVQLGTVPSFWLLGIPNVNAKFNALRLGPLDVAVTASGGQLRVGQGFTVTRAEVGALASLIVTDPWSIHAGASVGTLKVIGEPDLSKLSFLIDPLDRFGLDTFYDVLKSELDANEVSFDLHSQTLSARVASDYRFNRRDSLIVQGTAVLQRKVDWGYTLTTDGVETRYDQPLSTDELPDILGLREFFTEGQRPISASAVVSASYQWSWRHVDLRLGLGWSAVQPAWLLQAVDLDYRFGGKTRHEERRIRKYWRKDRKNIDNPDQAAPDEPRKKGTDIQDDE